MKLKTTEIRDYRIRQLGLQDYTCALCGEDCDTDQAVLDHDHRSGRIRRVLHRGCNAMLGKIENNMARNRITVDRLKTFAENLVQYITEEHTEMVHPTYKTKEERKMGRGRGKGRKPPKR